MREKGLANTTTKAIAAEAGCSEALLYKHFTDKQELFLLVLTERMPSVEIPIENVGRTDLADTLTELVARLIEFFRQTFPIAGSIFGTPELLAQHREAVTGRGFGPRGPLVRVVAYLDAEREAGRVARDVDSESVARALVGAAFHQGFLAAFEGDRLDDAPGVAAGVVAIVLPSLLPWSEEAPSGRGKGHLVG